MVVVGFTVGESVEAGFVDVGMKKSAYVSS
jgi:hypothetical protein